MQSSSDAASQSQFEAMQELDDLAAITKSPAILQKLERLANIQAKLGSWLQIRGDIGRMRYAGTMYSRGQE